MSEVRRYDLCGFGGGLVIREGGFVVGSDDFDSALAREAALREELGIATRHLDRMIEAHDDAQQRLTVAEKRAGELEGLLRDASAWIKRNSFHGTDAIELWERIDSALKPAEDVEIERGQGIPGTSFQRLNQLANEGE